jgi:hypothetical protein
MDGFEPVTLRSPKFDRLSSSIPRLALDQSRIKLARREGLSLLRRFIDVVRRELFTPLPVPTSGLTPRRVTQKGVGPEIRSRLVTKLVQAIDEAKRLAKESGRRSRSGAGGISPKERWYLVMGYLAQVLDGVLKNFDLESVKALHFAKSCFFE